MKTIKEVEQEIIGEFQKRSSVDEKYTHLFSLGEQLPEMDPNLKTGENQVKGCESTVWFYLRNDQGRLNLEADSDSLVIKGIAALLARVISGRRPEELRAFSLDFINEIDVWKLPSQRNSGLMAMLSHIKNQAEIMERNAPANKETTEWEN